MSTAIYATHAELRSRINKTGTEADAIFDSLLSAASRAIDGICNRPDGFLAPALGTARYYPGSGKTYQWIDECAAISAVAVKDSPSDDENAYTAWILGVIGTTTGADVFPATGDPEHPDFTRTPYTLLVVGLNGSYGAFTGGYGQPTVKVTARWGYSLTIPAQVKEACVLQAARWYKRAESAWADAMANAEMGMLLYRKSLDPDLEAMLISARLVRPAIGRR